MAVTVTPPRYSLTTPIQVFTGRFRPDLASLDAEPITDWESTPLVLGERLPTAPALIVWDPLAFPWDTLGREASGLPLWIALDSSRPETGSLVELLGEQMLRRITFFDRIVTDSPKIADSLVQHYGLGWSQMTVVERLDLARVVDEASSELAAPDLSELTDWRDADAYWEARAGLLATTHPAQAVLEPRLRLDANKSLHSEQARVLRPLLVGSDSPKSRSVVEIGCGVGRWAAGLPSRVSYAGFDVSDSMLAAAKANFPGLDFKRLGSQDSISIPGETCDVVFTCSVLQHIHPARRNRLIKSMFAALRVGGTLAFMEDFVFPAQPDDLVLSHPVGVRSFMDEVMDATSGNVVLSHVQSLRYGNEPSRRTALLSLTKVGSPRSL